jgi:hypothetical protein
MVAIVVLNLTQFLCIGLLGLFVSVWPDFTARHRRTIAGSFVAASLLACGFSIVLGVQQDREMTSVRENLLGGTSFPIVQPQPPYTQRQSLAVLNFGRAILTGVTVSKRCQVADDLETETVGTIPSHGYAPISMNLGLQECWSRSDLMIQGQRVASYWFETSAQNGRYLQIIQFKPSRSCANRWAMRFWIQSGVGVGWDKNGRPARDSDTKQKELYQVPDKSGDWVGDNDLC